MKKKKLRNFSFDYQTSFFFISTLFLGILIGVYLSNSQMKGESILDQIMPYDKGSISYISQSIDINRSSYSLKYDFRTKNPICVYEKITSENLEGFGNRSHIQFKEDFLIPKVFRTKIQDFIKSGFDRGHLAPAANHKTNNSEMFETFYLSNICPQCPTFNRGFWLKLEKYVRSLAKSYKLEVYSGPIYSPYQDKNGKKYVKYEVIGKSNIAVPTHFYKVIVMTDKVGKKVIESFVLPNNNIPLDIPLEKFKVKIEQVENLAGLLFNSINK